MTPLRAWTRNLMAVPTMRTHRTLSLVKQLLLPEWRNVEKRLTNSMLEKKEDGNFTMKTARDVRKRIRETSGELISLWTIQRDLRALNHIWKRMPVVPCMAAKHITRRMDLGPALLELNLQDILFSDESYFDTCDTHRGAYQRDGHAQQTRPKERYVTKVMVWGVIGVGYAKLVIMNSGTVNATHNCE